MGTYVNPGNSGFARIAGHNYVDKTGMIELINERINGEKSLVCVSRPRRFGKSYAAKMLTAYYDCSCDSESLFRDKAISASADYRTYMNQFNVIHLDVTGFTSAVRAHGQSFRVVPAMIEDAIRKDLIEEGFQPGENDTLQDFLIRCVQQSDGRAFVFIIDEWDALIREAKEDVQAQEAYLNLLRGWFKNSNFTPKAVAAAFMTGILPIKKDGSQSAISDFQEFSMIKPRRFGEFVGFTEDEVKGICEENHSDFLTMKRWYDGYSFEQVGSVYNPNSVIQAVQNGDFDSYWTESSAAEGLMDYISRDYHGLTQTIAGLVGGVDEPVNTTGFANDLTTFWSKDDVLTLMIHLGYLAYDARRGVVRIPNEEIRMEFQKAVREVNHAETMKRLAESDQLFLDTIHGEEAAVAAQIEKIHREETAPQHYNREDSLRSVIKLAYYTYRDHYIQLEELPGGEGFADVVYLPRRSSDWPALVVELKWNRGACGAIDQILERKYPEPIKNFGGRILLVGINYDKEASVGKRKHTCRIWEYDVSKEG